MKKFFLLLTTICLIMVSQPAIASNELIEDYLDIATSYAVSGNYPAAMEYLDKILTIEPQNRNILGLKNTLRQMQTGTFVSPMIAGTPKLFQAQNAKKAGNKLGEQQFLTSAATDGGYWTNMFAGDYYREAKQYQKALSYYQQAMSSSKNSSSPLLYMGICHFEMKNYDSAYPLLTKFIAYNQQESYAYAIRARVLTELGRFNEAETDIITAIALEDTIEYRYLEGLILFKRGNYKKAQIALSKIANEIQTSDVYKFLGMSYYATGDLNNALLNLDKALLLAGDDIELKTQYNQIKTKLTNQVLQ
ncbi:tetratricopeptide repeat protein [bacterium]|nr:tetratricopeptide repeat protein [bacterium]